jgi:hypothetical protein
MMTIRMNRNRLVAIAAVISALGLVGGIYATTTYTAKSTVSYNITPDLTLTLPASLAIGSIAAGASGTTTFSNGLTLAGANSYAYTISGSLSGNFSGYSVFSIQVRNSGGPACTVSIATPTCQWTFASPQSLSYDLILSWTANVLTTSLTSSQAAINFVVTTSGP